MKTLIRHSRRQDLPVLLAIDQACFPAGIAYTAEEFQHFMTRRGSVSLVAEIDDEIAGFLVMEMDGPGAATLITLDVREACRRLGLASRLLAVSERILKRRKVPAYVLQVNTENVAAIRLYEKDGFTKARRLPRYYNDGSDAYMMAKVL